MTLDMSRTHVAQNDRIPAALAGKPTGKPAGRPRLSTRISYRDRSITAGVFEATRGKVEVTFPCTEYATILEGEVTITDESGRRHTYRKGDSYLVLGGQPVVLDVRCARVRQSFFSLIEC